MNKRAIIIDDERLARAELRKLLTDFPEIEVLDEAANVEEALEKIDLLQPDIIFLDINMPGKSGLDLLEKVKSEFKNPPPIMMMITAYGDDLNFQKAKQLGADDFFTKPVDFLKLKERINNF